MSLCEYQYIEDEQKNQKEDICDLQLYKHLGKGLPVINSLNDLTKELRCVFDSDSVNIELVDYLMKSYKSNPADFRQYAKFNRYRYTRNLVDSGNGKYNLMTLCWGEGHGSPIHDHANSHCFMKMLQGSLMEIRFAWPEKEGQELNVISKRKLELNDVCYINDSIGLHRVENQSHSDPAISLHLYCPPYNKCSIFNQSTGHKSSAGVTFYSIYGKRNKVSIVTEAIRDLPHILHALLGKVKKYTTKPYLKKGGKQILNGFAMLLQSRGQQYVVMSELVKSSTFFNTSM